MVNPLSFDEQKGLLIKGWMSHDARWFTAVREHFGIDAANRLNQTVCRELGRVEMQRLVKGLGVTPPRNIDEYLTLKKEAIKLYGSDLIEYEIEVLDDQSYKMHLKRCFAYENIVKAGIKDQYECGIFARLQGWIDAQGIEHKLSPPLGKCMKALGEECYYVIDLQFTNESIIEKTRSSENLP